MADGERAPPDDAGWPSRRGRAAAVVVVAAAAVALAAACRAPTQIVLELSTDAPCADVRGTAISVARPEALEGSPPVAVTEACDPSTGRIGSLVVVPGRADDDVVAVKVVTGVGRHATTCAPPRYEGCIVARRAVRFVAHASLDVPVRMTLECRDVACTETTTCDGRVCAPYGEPPRACVGAGTCDAGTPPPPEDAAARDGAEGDGALVDAAPACGSVAPCASTLQDDFEDGVPDAALWTVQASACRVEEKAGVIRFEPPKNQNAYCWYETRSVYDLRGPGLKVRVPHVTTSTLGVQTFIYLRGPRGAELEVYIIKEGTGFVFTSDGRSAGSSDDYDRSKEPYWWLAADGKRLVFRTGATAQGPWTQRGAVDHPLGFERVRILFGAGTWMPLADPGSASFDCLNKSCP